MKITLKTGENLLPYVGGKSYQKMIRQCKELGCKYQFVYVKSHANPGGYSKHLFIHSREGQIMIHDNPNIQQLLLEALIYLVADVERKPNDTRYATAIAKAKAAIKKARE